MIWLTIMEIMSKSFFIIKKNCDNKVPFSTKFNDTDKKLLDNLKNNLPN